ncbi:MAG: SDR family NAD(P)-dependent oxidoreductase [Acidimicrobiia bacterium]
MSGDLFSVESKRVLITGGTAGIGKAVAERFVAAGARVVVAASSQSGVNVAEAIGAGFVGLDVADGEAFSVALESASVQLGGRLDVLVLNAGIDKEVGVAGHLDLASFRRVLDVNLMGVVYGLAFGPAHLEEGSSIIVSSSPAGRISIAGLGAYSASKAAVDSLVRTAAIELAPRNIRVNAVLPGVVETAMSGGATGDGAALAVLTATNRLRQACEIAPVYQFLASDAAVTVTGATLQADDGMTAGLSTHLIERAFGEGGVA